jgi:hypothetical protein
MAATIAQAPPPCPANLILRLQQVEQQDDQQYQND